MMSYMTFWHFSLHGLLAWITLIRVVDGLWAVRVCMGYIPGLG